MKKPLLYLLLAVAMSFVNKAAAATYNWTGAGDGKWSTNANWNPSTGHPVAGDVAIIGNTAFTGLQPTVDVNSACATLTIGTNTAVTLNVNATLTVSGTTTSPAGTKIITTGVFNTGVLTINGSTFTLGAGLNVTTGPLTFNGGTTTINNTTNTIAVTGAVSETGSTTVVNLGAPLTCTTFGVSAGTFNANNSVTASGAATITTNIITTAPFSSASLSLGTGTNTFGGKLTVSGALSAGNTTVTTNATGNTISGTVTGSGDLVWNGSGSTTISGAMNFAMKTSLTIGSGNTMTFSGNTLTFDKMTTFTNNGTTNCTGCSISMDGNNHNTFVNAGTFNASANASISISKAQSTFTNQLGGIFNVGLTNSPCSLTFSSTDFENYGVLTIASTSVLTAGSNVVNNSSGVFTLLSDQYGSASIGNSSGSFSGLYNVQRYLTGANNFQYRGYRFMSSPVNTAGKVDLSTISNAYTVNGVTNYGALAAGTGSGLFIYNANPTLYLYQEPLNPSAATVNSSFVSGKFPGITSISGTNLGYLSTTNGTNVTGTTTLAPGNGYLMYFVGSTDPTVRTSGSPSIAPDNTTVTYVGTLNQGTITATLWFNTNEKLSFTNGITEAGLNLLGNPYASTIDLHQLWLDNGSPAYNTFYELVDIAPGQSFVTYNANKQLTSSGYASQYIASGQGFFVAANAANQTLQFKEDQKVYNPALLNSSSNPPILLSTQKNNTVSTNMAVKHTDALKPQNFAGLHLVLNKQDGTNDACGVYFDKSWSDNADTDDAPDLDGLSPKVFLSTYSADKMRLSINALSDYSKGKRIKVFAKSTTNGVHYLSLSDFNNIDTAAFNIYLVDQYKNDSLDMARYKTYAFDINLADTNSFGANRFVLAIERRPLPPYQLIAFTGQKVTGGIQLSWKTYNEGNFTGFVLQKLGADKSYSNIDSLQSNGSTNYTFTDNSVFTGTNTYRLQQSDIDGKITYSTPVTIQYSSDSAPGLFTISPNPATELITINVASLNSNQQNYISNIYNTLGNLVVQRNVSGTSWSEDVTSYKAGIYIIELKSADGKLIGKSKFMKTN